MQRPHRGDQKHFRQGHGKGNQKEVEALEQNRLEGKKLEGF